ncbi:MAG: hypothetical protein E7071_04760 [Bacteroidales bacterium]|nr:hypothetical protein [Bacteroidales bacterium]
MKSRFTLFLSLIVALLTVACQSDDLCENESLDRVAIDVSLSIDNSSRISYTSDFALAFSPNDKMEIMERNLMDITTLVYNYDLGQFLGKIYVPRNAQSYEVCTHVGAKSYSAEKATFEISSSQIGSAGVYLAGLWQLTNFQDLSLQMAQLSSMLAFTVNPSSDGISEIILESVAGEMIAGTLEYDYEDLVYRLNGTSSKISVKPVVSPTSATQYVINILPVSLSKGAYLTIVDKKGNKMRLTLNYESVCNFDINKVVILPDVINQQSVGVELGKVYSSYTVDEVPTPNNNLDGSTIWVEQSRSVGISTALVKEAGLYVDGVKHIGTYSTDGVISALTLSSQSWAEHSVEAYIVDLDGVEVRSAAKSVAVTGLPYTRSFEGISSSILSDNWGWKHSSLVSASDNGVQMTIDSYITTPQFYIPNTILVNTIITNTTNDLTAANQIIYATPVSREMGRTITGGVTVAANYNGDYSPSNATDSEVSSAITLTKVKPCLQYSTLVTGGMFWVEYTLYVTKVVINYAN